MGVSPGCGLTPRRQAERLLQQQVHLLSHFINGRLRAQGGCLRVAFQALAIHESLWPHQTVDVRLLNQLGLRLKNIRKDIETQVLKYVQTVQDIF